MKSPGLMKNKTLRQQRAQFLLEETEPMLMSGDLEVPRIVDASEPLSLVSGKVGLDLKIVEATTEVATALESELHGALIFGSSVKPGGGWKNGAIAQEEDVSLHSSWGAQAEKTPDGYYGKVDGLGPDLVLMAEGVWIVHPEQYVRPKNTPVLFAGVAAPNKNHEETKKTKSAALIDMLARRLRTAFNEWHNAGVKRVYAGAIGCGVFKWKPEDSALAMRMAIESSQWSGELVLAMPDKSMNTPFSMELMKLQK